MCPAYVTVACVSIEEFFFLEKTSQKKDEGKWMKTTRVEQVNRAGA